MGQACHRRASDNGAPDIDAYSSGHSLAPLLRPTGPFGSLFAKLPAARASTDPFVPDIVIDESMPLHDYGVDARVLTTPGHTPGSISVLADSGELIAGDLIAGSFLGAVRHRPANPPFHHDRTLNLASHDAVLALDPAVGYVGHGGRWSRRAYDVGQKENTADSLVGEQRQPDGCPIGEVPWS